MGAGAPPRPPPHLRYSHNRPLTLERRDVRASRDAEGHQSREEGTKSHRPVRAVCRSRVGLGEDTTASTDEINRDVETQL